MNEEQEELDDYELSLNNSQQSNRHQTARREQMIDIGNAVGSLRNEDISEPRRE
jgi:hypothetical protein